MADDATWERRLLRERAARREAERLLIERARDLEMANRRLAASYESLNAAAAAAMEREKLAAFGALMGGIAHELNTPLGVAYTASSTGAESIRRFRSMSDAAPDELDALLARVERAFTLSLRNLERAQAHVERFKMVSADQVADRTRVVDLDQFVSDTLQSLSPLLSAHKVRLDLQTGFGIRARVPTGALSQVLTNLVSNACVHAFDDEMNDERRTITVLGSSTSTGVVLSIADRGRGMTPDVAGRVFEPFFTTAHDRGGTGLGMQIVQQVVERVFNGTITLTTAPGEGACWTLSLPTDRAEAAITDTRSSRVMEQAHGASPEAL